MFEAMLARIREQTVEYLFRIQAPRPVERPALPAGEHPEFQDEIAERGPGGGNGRAAPPASLLRKPVKPVPAGLEKIGRNDPCYCGSGKKFKKCHGS